MIGPAGWPALHAPVSWRVVGPLSATPAQAYFGLLATGEEKTLNVLIHTAGKNPFLIKSIESDSSRVRAEAPNPALPPGRSHRIVAKFRPDPSSQDRAASGLLTIKMDLNGAETIKVPWSAFLLPKVGGTGDAGRESVEAKGKEGSQ